ncbi:uclacyanin 1-like [Papaver somniferum]|uniref:uclacyanin 1-like n=1 Tax=Papaver somniferum TaxID=3469 RepID=UPI000E702171|nr:uclacyanin 1-like [Papaver somniferum]
MAANKQIFIILAIVAIMFPLIALATDHVVGDDKGWNNKFDYAAWAKDKQFYVGDTLSFMYTPGSHNVFKVNGTEFDQCIKPEPKLAIATGNDVTTLATPGKKCIYLLLTLPCSTTHPLSSVLPTVSSFTG